MKRKTVEQFIQNAKEIHGNLYDYSKVTEYKNNTTPVPIICKEHGIFEQTPKAHLKGSICPKCSRNAPWTTQKFIERANIVHNNRYQYSEETEYKNQYTKMTIICEKHGPFKQSANNHLKGSGCPKCAIESDMTTQKFIEKANIIHNNRYQYSEETEYKNQYTEMTIICEKHGAFKQIAKLHLRGSGCPKCGKESMTQKQTNKFEDFEKKARNVHGDKYDYIKESFIGLRYKTTIICPKHGKFEQSASKHLLGRGCYECAKEINKEKHTRTFDYFLENARLAHGNKYEYVEESYLGMQENLNIICPIHGEFSQQATRHAIEKCGCPECGKQKMGDAHNKGFDYFLQRARQIHGNKYQYKKETFINTHHKLTIICPVHGEFRQNASSHTNGQGCPTCRESKLERKVSQYLKDLNLEFEPQKTFDWLINDKTGKNLFCDFYIPSLHLAIECQGEQHFSLETSFFKNEENFKEIIWRDNEKNRLCKEHNIDIVYFADNKPYIKGYRYPVITDINKLLSV